MRLDPTYPKLINIASETLGFRHPEFSSGESLLMSAFSLLKSRQLFTLLLHCLQDAPLPIALDATFYLR